MRPYPLLTKDISKAVEMIASGRAVAFPTGTSYGLAVDALQGHALQRLRNLKGRDVEKTFTICLRENLWDTFLDLTDIDKELFKKYTGKAVTVLVSPKSALEHLAHKGRVGLRIADHPVMQQFVNACDVPITATSANISGQPPCYIPECITKSFPGLLDPEDTRHGDIRRAGHTTYDLSLGAILDVGQLTTKGASTIIQAGKDGKIEVVRQGNVEI